MRVILFGATGMVGQGALRECLVASDVEHVASVVRSATSERHEKLEELVQPDLMQLDPARLTGYDGCLFCLGVSSVGMSEAEYHKVTYNLTLSVANRLVQLNPNMTFVYVSGQSTDSTETGSSMWARVKGKTENALLRLPFKRAYMFRPGYIQPLDGVRARTRWTRALYAVFGPFYPVWKALFPKFVTTTSELGRAMLSCVAEGFDQPIVNPVDYGRLAARRP